MKCRRRIDPSHGTANKSTLADTVLDRLLHACTSRIAHKCYCCCAVHSRLQRATSHAGMYSAMLFNHTWESTTCHVPRELRNPQKAHASAHDRPLNTAMKYTTSTLPLSVAEPHLVSTESDRRLGRMRENRPIVCVSRQKRIRAESVLKAMPATYTRKNEPTVSVRNGFPLYTQFL